MLFLSTGTVCADTPIGPAPTTGMTDMGVAPPSRTVQVALTLRYRHEAELEALVAAQADRGSARFGQFLSAQAFAAWYAPSQAVHDRVVAALTRAGFTVAATYPHRGVILARAPAPVVARTFGTELHEVDQPGQGRRYANLTAASIPGEIADVVTGVVGLSDVRAFQTFVERPSAPVAKPTAASLAAAVLGPDGGYGPRVYRDAYALLGQRGLTGRGRAGAIVIDADFLDSDLAAFLTQFGIRRTGRNVRVNVLEGPPPGLSDDSVETALDIETMAAQAPAADIYVYEGPDFRNPSNLVAAYAQVLADDKVDLVNASLGYCETAFGTFPQMVEQLAIHGAALGITFHASSGDNGAGVFGCGGGAHVAVPAIAPHVVAVGGTDLKADVLTGAFRKEFAWNDGRQRGATGGGVSTLFPLPAFQVGVPGIATGGRNSPDVAFTAAPNDGTAFFYDGFWSGPLGGTSLSSPLFGGALLQFNQSRGGRSGFVTPLIYAAWRQVGYTSDGVDYFRDITTGTLRRQISPGNVVGPGYDRLTGIGPLLFQATAPLLRP